MATPYQIPSSFSGGMQGAVESLKRGQLPQARPLAQPGIPPVPFISEEQKSFLPQKPLPVDPNKTADAFKSKILAKHPDAVALDGRRYADIPAVELTAKIVRKYPDAVTNDGVKYQEFLPRPASPNDSLDYRLKQIESLYNGPKSEFYAPNSTMRGQTVEEKKFGDKLLKRENESEVIKTLKAPYRAVYNAMENPSQGLQMAVSDALDLVGANETSKKITRGLIQEKSQQDLLNKDNKGLIGGIQEGSPSSIIGSLVTAIPNLLLYANPAGATAGIISTGGGLSLEGEMQGQNTAGDKAIAYSAGTISGLIDKISGQRFLDGLLSKGIKKEVANGFVTKTKNFLASLQPSDFEAGTEVIQQKIENWGRQLMGTEYDKGWKQYAEAGLMGKIMAKVGDVGFADAPTTILPPKPPATPRPVGKNLEVIQTIKTGLGGNKVLKQAKNRGFDPELDIATYEDLKPTITNDGRVNTDVAQENIQNFIEPYQEKLDQAIEQEGAIVPSDTFRQNVLKEMEGEKGNIVDYKKWVKLANDAIDTAVENFGDEQGNIPLASVNAIKKKLQMASNYLNPDDTAYKAIARGAKQIVEDFTKSADVKALNKDLARWYTTREYLQILGSGTKTVKGGRLGKYAARLSGIIIGSHLGPIAGMIGGEVAAKLQSEMMKGALKNTNTGMPEIESFNNIKLPSRQTSEDTMASKTMLPPPAQVSEGTRKKEVVLPKKESSGEKVIPPIIPKSQPKAKLRTNEDALAKPKKTEVKAKLPQAKTLEEYNKGLQATDLKALKEKYKGQSITVKTKSGKEVTYEADKDLDGFMMAKESGLPEVKANLPKERKLPKKQEDWTKKDFTKSTTSKTTDRYGNTITQDAKANRSIEVGGNKYNEVDLPETSKPFYTKDGEIYEYKDGKMISESKLPKTPQEGETVEKGVYDEVVKPSTSDIKITNDFAYWSSLQKEPSGTRKTVKIIGANAGPNDMIIRTDKGNFQRNAQTMYKKVPVKVLTENVAGGKRYKVVDAKGDMLDTYDGKLQKEEVMDILKKKGATFIGEADNYTGKPSLPLSQKSEVKYSEAKPTLKTIEGDGMKQGLIRGRDSGSNEWAHPAEGYLQAPGIVYGRQHPGFASENSARIAVNKAPELKGKEVFITKFRYRMPGTPVNIVDRFLTLIKE